MKKILYSILVMSFICLTFSSMAQATVVNLFDQFPDNQGDNGLSAYAYDPASQTNRNLDDVGSFLFATTGQPFNIPIVAQNWNGFGVFLHPSDMPSCAVNYPPEDAVLAWNVPMTTMFDIVGSFWDSGNSGDFLVYVRRTDTLNNNTILWSQIIGNGGSALFDLQDQPLQQGDILSFGVNANGDDYSDWGNLRGEISYNNQNNITNTPIPGSLMLLASSLLGLVGLRRKIS